MGASPKFTLTANLLQSFLSTWALMKAARMEPGNILTILFFLLCFLFFRHADRRCSKAGCFQNKAFRPTAAVLSVIFTLFYLIVDYRNYINTLTNPLFRLGITAAAFLGFVFLFYYVLMFLYSYVDHSSGQSSFLFSDSFELSGSSRSKAVLAVLGFYCRFTGPCVFLLCLVCWLPYFLYQYPGIMTPDSIHQFEQVLGIIPYSNHHPWIHTLLIQLLYSFGSLFTQDPVIAISFYTFFQMCALAGSAAYLADTLKLYQVKPVICFLTALFYALVPYHAVYSITLWKDILFAAAVLVLGCAMLRMAQKITWQSLCLFALSGLMICLFRSNGWYAFCLCLPFLLFHYRKRAKLMAPVLLGIFLSAAVIKYPVMNAFEVTQPDLVESLAIPIQQVTAVLCSDRPLRADQQALVEKVVDLTYIKELRDPCYADNMKELVRAGNTEYLSAHKGDYLRLWLELGLAYPGDYLTAYIQQTYGYWYPDSFYPVAEAEGISATQYGVSHTPLIGGPLVVKAKEIAIKLGSILPLYGTLWSMGAAFWVLLFCIGSSFIRHEKEKRILYLPSLALWLTVMIATPVASEFRYVYFMIFALPFYLFTAVLPCKKEPPAGDS